MRSTDVATAAMYWAVPDYTCPGHAIGANTGVQMGITRTLHVPTMTAHVTKLATTRIRRRMRVCTTVLSDSHACILGEHRAIVFAVHCQKYRILLMFSNRINVIMYYNV